MHADGVTLISVIVNMHACADAGVTSIVTFIAAPRMQVTSSSLIDCLVKNGLCTENVRLQCRSIGFHPCNRDGCGVVPSEVQD